MAAHLKGSAAKTLISILLLYHLVVILTVPNPFSMMARRIWPFISPYASQLGINTGWQFFSPAPTPATYLEYTVTHKQYKVYDGAVSTGDGRVAPNDGHMAAQETFFFPPTGAGPVRGSNEARFLAAMRYFTLHPQRFKVALVPYLCRKHPQAQKLSFEHVMELHAQPKSLTFTQSYVDLVESLKMKPLVVECLPQSGGDLQ